MPFLGIDSGQARQVATTLRGVATHATLIERQVADAERQAELAVNVTLLLDQLTEDLRTTSLAIETAAYRINSHKLSSVSSAAFLGWRARAVAHAAQSSRIDAGPGWNEVRQEASHNTYEFAGGIGALYANGVRTFELDIHRGAPAELTSHNRATRANDWRVYHFSGSSASEYEYLTDGLAVVAALDAAEPITLFIDNKDDFHGTHDAVQLNDVVRTALGARLYTPGDVLSRAPGAGSLSEAIAQRGWPTASELHGRVIVVLTDNIHGFDVTDPGLFVAAPPEFDAARGGAPVLHPDVVFYNADAGALSDDQIVALQANGMVVRTYENPPCGPATFDPVSGVPVSSPANYRARHIDFAPTGCPAPVPHPPPGTPVPERALGSG